jgi:hypothetical protein
VWVGAISPADAANANSGGVLTTPDNSCTVPAIPLAGFPFVTFAFDGSAGNAPRDHNVTALPRYSNIDRTREGYVEMIEMGVVQAGSAFANAATHNTAGRPANCALLTQAWLPSGSWSSTNGAANIQLPTGGLYGSGAIVNAAEGIMYSYDAVALEGFYTNGNAPAALHTDPVRVVPNLGSADSGGGVSRSTVIANNGQTLVVDTWAPVGLVGAAGGWDSVSALFMHDNVYNEYVTAASLGATSEWVLNFPTKNFYVDRATARAPFSNVFFATTTAPGACERYSIGIWDREEQIPRDVPGGLVPSPPPPGPSPLIPVFCYEAQVVSFNQTLTAISPGFRSETANLGARYAENIPANSGPGGTPANTAFGAGHARLTFGETSQRLINPTSGNRYQGLPVIGFWTLRAINGNLGGTLANYSGTWEHKYSRDITSVAPQ